MGESIASGNRIAITLLLATASGSPAPAGRAWAMFSASSSRANFSRQERAGKVDLAPPLAVLRYARARPAGANAGGPCEQGRYRELPMRPGWSVHGLRYRLQLDDPVVLRPIRCAAFARRSCRDCIAAIWAGARRDARVGRYGRPAGRALAVLDISAGSIHS